MNSSNNRTTRDYSFFIGLAFLVVGAYLFLDSVIGIRSLDFILRYIAYASPLILTAVGIATILSEKRFMAFGIFLAGSGLFFTLVNFGVFPMIEVTAKLVIAFVILGIGLVFVTQLTGARHATDGQIGVTAMFGGSTHRFKGKLSGGRITSFYGGSTIDLRQVEMDGNLIEINCLVLFGGAHIRIPYGWEVEFKGLPLLGGANNRVASFDPNSVDVPRKVRFTGLLMFGGIEVFN